MSDETGLMTQQNIMRESEIRETENLRQYAEGEDPPTTTSTEVATATFLRFA